MKRYIVLLMIIVSLTGCQKFNSADSTVLVEHNKQVLSHNSIVDNVYYNDFIGFRLTLGNGFNIINYDELNLSEKTKEIGNLLMYASAGSIETIVITEKMYENADFIKDTEESLEVRFKELNIESELVKEQIVLNDMDVTVFMVKEDYGDNNFVHYNYYFLHHRDSLITILLSYDYESNQKLPNDFLSWIELY